MSVSDQLRRLDRYQQGHRRVSFIAAVIKKFGDDQAGQLAALISYYAFVSIFPLLLVFVSILGFVIHGDPAQQQKVLNGTLGQVPILRQGLEGGTVLSGSGAALGIGLVLSLLAGLAVTSAAQNAFNRIWHVPFKSRPDFVKSKLRGLGVLAVLGSLNVVSTFVAGFVSASSHSVLTGIAGIVVAFAFNLLLFSAAFRLLTAVDVAWRDLAPGIIVAAVAWQVLQHLGGLYVHKVTHDKELYGTFGVTLGLLAFLYLGAQLTIFAAEINVVRLYDLWPRSFFAPPLTDADKRALTSSAEIEERFHEETVEVTFDDGASSRAEAGKTSAVDGR